ncbi:OmpA family protein [Capnocytophaga sp.]|uniref:OmpA family protein n=1 Tax=Capnocytophaga sp. TaxID=44737 RepID=UPI0026DBE8F3|nr:OmpA family protein [Capnocytophaga sp.]MDO5105711.1 OmpA family protein [Capnocytophaga sp.]
MKKIILSAMMAVAAITASAQEQGLSQSKFFDNWQIGVNAGGYLPTKGYDLIKDVRFNFGAELSKQISPVFRLGFDANAYLNQNWNGAERNPLVIEETNVALIGAFNLNNLFAGYNGMPRKFEVEAFAGPGWLHKFEMGDNNNYNVMTAKFGANFILNLGESKAFAIKLSPSILYFVDAPSSDAANSLNINYSNSQVNLGIVYRFKGSNGARHFTTIEGRNQAEIDQLNSNISSLQSQVNGKESELNSAKQRISQLESDLQAAKNQQPVVQTVTKTKNTLESVVTFGLGKSTVDASQLPNVERIATYLKKYPNSRVVIKGYASPEGNEEKNIALANARAESVKKVLIARYKIAADRIVAQGNGIGDMFSEPEWNRVSIATIEENK